MERQDHSATGAQTSAFLEGNIALQLVMYSDGSCDVHIKLDAVAPFHCKLERMEDGRVFIESLSKTAKTFLNGVPVTKRTFVAHDSLLTVVDRNFKFLYPESSVYILKSALCGAKKGVPLSPLLTSSSRCISGVSSFPAVISSSPKPSPLQNEHVKTPTLSSQRRGLSTRERYGPTPTRPAAMPPVVSVERHSLKRGSYKTGNYSSPMRKHLKVNAVSNTPVTSGSPSIRCLRSSSTSKKETSQTNNSSYHSLTANQTGQIGFFDVSFKLPNASSTLLITGKSRDNILANVNSAGALDVAPDGQSKSPDSPVSQGVTSTSKRVSRDSSIRQSSPGSAALRNSTWAEETRQLNTSLRVERRLLPKLIDSDQEVAKPQPKTSGNYSKECCAVKKGVQFGPRLSPEQFDSRLPPSTPVRRGELPPSSSLQRTYASIVKHRRSTSMPPTLKDGRSASLEQFGPQKASVKLRTKPNLRALSRNLMDSFIDDSTAALKNLANGNLDSPALDPICAAIAKPMAFSKVSSPELGNTESGQSSKLPSVVTNDSNVDMDHEGRSHDTSNLLTPIRTGGRGRSVQSAPSRRRGIVTASYRCPAGRTLANAIGITDTKPNGRRGGSLPASKLNIQLSRPSSTSRSRDASSSRVSFSDTSFALQSSVQQSGTRNVSLSNYSTLEACLEYMGTSNAPSPGRSPGVRTHTNAPKIQSSSRLSSARRPARTSRTESFPALSDTQGIVSVPAFSGSDSSSVQPSKTKPGPELRMSTRFSSVRSLIKTPDVQDSSRLSGIRELMKTPKSTLSPRLSGVRKLVEPRKVTVSPVASGIRELVKAPNSVSPSGLPAVGKLVKTPNIQSSEIGVIRKLPESLEPVLSPSLSGAQKLAKTPMVQASAELSDIEELVQTPKSVPSLRLSGFQKLAKTSQVQTSPKLSGVRKLVKTAKLLPSPRLSGVRRLVNTPKVQASPQLSGIRNLVKTPITISSPRLSGVRRLVKTPKARASPRLSGIRELVKSPKSQPSPRLSGVRRLVKTPKVQASPRLSGIRKLMKTPKSLLSPRLSGVRRLMKTPEVQASPELSGIRELIETPKSIPSPRLSSVKELVKTPEVQPPPKFSEIRGLMNVPRSLLSLKPSGLHNLMEIPNSLKSEVASQKNTTSRLKRSNVTHLSSPGKKRRLQKLKDANASPTLPSALSEIRQTRSRTKARTTDLNKSAAGVVANLDREAEKVQKRKRVGRTKSVPSTSMESSVSSASENEGKGSAFAICPLIVRPKKVGNRRTGPSSCGALDSPLPPSTHQKGRGARTGKPTASAVIRTPTSNRKRRASSGKSSIPQSAPLRRSKRTAPRRDEVSPSVQPRQVKIRKKVQFSNPEAIDIGGAASTVGVDEVDGGVGATSTGRKFGISSKLVSPKGGIVPRQTRQRRKAAASPTLKPLRRGHSKQ
ncbi:Proliferation marker protein Ki-67 [Taenia solium]|eukprot:TsM_000956500 transcript=TsM_000956500 gene=TsM_000956500